MCFSFWSSGSFCWDANFLCFLTTGLTEYLLSCDFTALFQSSDMEEIWHILSNSILSGIDLFISKIRIHTCKFPNLFDSQLRHSLKCLRTLQRKYNKFPTPSNFDRLTKAQDSFQAASIAAKSSYEQSLIHNYATTKDAKIFRYIKEFTKSHVLPPNCILTPQQLFQILTRLSYLMNTFILFLHIAILLYQSCLTSQLPATI